MTFMPKLNALTSVILALVASIALGQTGTPNSQVDVSSSASVLTSDVTTTSSSFAAFSTNFALPTLPPNSKKQGYCVLVWQQSASTSNTQRFALNTSAALTGLWINGSQYRGATGTVTNQLPIAAVSTATSTGATASMTPAATTTSYEVTVDFTVQTDSSHAETISIYGLVTGGTFTLKAGSSCSWLP